MKQQVKIPKSIEEKALNALETWCITFKLIGTRTETPRYSQLIKHNGVFTLKSTQKELFYDLELTEDENIFLENIEHYDRWGQWKEIRTNYLLENHKTISAY